MNKQGRVKTAIAIAAYVVPGIFALTMISSCDFAALSGPAGFSGAPLTGVGGAYLDSPPNNSINVASMITDQQGNIYTLGVSNANASDPTQTGVFLAKFNSVGVFKWINPIAASGGAGPVTGEIGGPGSNGIAQDSSTGNIIVIGSTTFDLTNGAPLPSSGRDYFVASYDSTTGSLVWLVQVGSTGLATNIMSVTTDAFGNVIVAGAAKDSLDLARCPYTAPKTDASGKIRRVSCSPTQLPYYSGFVTKFDSTGRYRWTAQPQNSCSTFMSVATNATGEIYAAGKGFTTAGGSPANGGSSCTGVTVFGGTFIAKYNPDGAALWATLQSGSLGNFWFNPWKWVAQYIGSGSGNLTGIAVHNGPATSDIFVAGFHNAGGKLGGIAQETIRNGYLMAKYTDDGSESPTLELLNYYGDRSGVEKKYGTQSVKLDVNENAFVIGYSGTGRFVQDCSLVGTPAIVNFYQCSNPISGNIGNYFVSKFSSSNVLQSGWPINVGGRASGRNADVALDTLGNIFVTGELLNSTSTTGVATQSWSLSTGTYDTFFVKYNPLGLLQ